MHLADGQHLPRSAAALGRVCAPHAPTAGSTSGRGPTAPPGENLGWRLAPQPHLVEHGGDAPGCGSMLWLVPAPKMAVPGAGETAATCRPCSPGSERKAAEPILLASAALHAARRQTPGPSTTSIATAAGTSFGKKCGYKCPPRGSALARPRGAQRRRHDGAPLPAKSCNLESGSFCRADGEECSCAWTRTAGAAQPSSSSRPMLMIGLATCTTVELHHGSPDSVSEVVGGRVGSRASVEGDLPVGSLVMSSARGRGVVPGAEHMQVVEVGAAAEGPACVVVHVGHAGWRVEPSTCSAGFDGGLRSSGLRCGSPSLRPRSRTWELPLRTAGMIPASQASRRAGPGEMVPRCRVRRP